MTSALKTPSSSCVNKLRSKTSFKSTFPLLLIVAATSLYLSSCISLSGAQQSCHLRELELCLISAGAVLQNPNGIPVNEQEFKRHCEYMQESCDCLQDYADRCFTKNHDLLAHMFMDDIFKLEKDICTNGSETKNLYMKQASCLRKVQLQYQRPCMTDFQVGFEEIHNLNVSLRIPTACCNTNRLKECLLPRVTENCGEDALQFVSNILTKMFGNVLTITCREFDPTSDTCQGLLPKSGTEPNKKRGVSAISKIVSSYSLRM